MEGNPKINAGDYLESVRRHIAPPPENVSGQGINTENSLRRLTQHAVLLALDDTQREMQDHNHVYQGDVAVLQRQLDMCFGGWMREQMHDKAAFDQERDRFKQLAQTLFDQRLEIEQGPQSGLREAA